MAGRSVDTEGHSEDTGGHGRTERWAPPSPNDPAMSLMAQA